MQAYRGSGLSLERVILDLHSGRIVGQWGVYVVDGAALLFLALVITGLWMWMKQEIKTYGRRPAAIIRFFRICGRNPRDKVVEFVCRILPVSLRHESFSD